VCKFTVAPNRFYKHEVELQKEVSYFDVSKVWTNKRKDLENLLRYPFLLLLCS
jgi:hypothetical protein